jgi:putative ABC transport system permease protein
MFLFRIMTTAIRSLRQNLLRSLLATLGVVIGVGAVVSAWSILDGTNRDILDRVESLGADQMIILPGSDRREHRNATKNTLTLEDVEKLESDHSDVIAAVAPQSQPPPTQIKYFEKNANVSILGTNGAFAVMNDYEPREGRFISREDVRGGAMVCVLGSKVAEELFGAKSALQETVKIEGKSIVVVGVMEEKGALGFTEADSQVFIPVTTVMGRLYSFKNVAMIIVQAVDVRRMEACKDRVKKTLRANHRVRAGEEDDFNIVTQERMKEMFGQFSKIFAIVLGSIAGISLVVGGIGIMNIMLVSVTERTREIGVRIAVGARRFDILRQFLTEASVISLLGGGFGVLCGWAIANLIAETTQVLKIYTSPTSVIYALVMAIVVGVISGIYPAIRASRLDPVEALRYE